MSLVHVFFVVFLFVLFFPSVSSISLLLFLVFFLSYIDWWGYQICPQGLGHLLSDLVYIPGGNGVGLGFFSLLDHNGTGHLVCMLDHILDWQGNRHWALFLCCSSLPSVVAPFSLLLLSAYQHSSPHHSNLIPGVKGVGLIEHKRDRVGGPHLSQDLQVGGTGGVVVVICVFLAMVVAIIILDVGSGAHRNASFLALGGTKHPMSSLLCLLLL